MTDIKKHFVFFFFIIILSSGCVFSPLETEEERNWSTIWINNSNPYSNTFNVLSTGDGTLWAGTDGGVHKFENEKYNTTYTTKNGLGSNIIYSLAQGTEGIWAGSSNGLYFLSDSTWSIVSSISGNLLVEVIDYHNGMLWAGTSNGLFQLDPQGNIIRQFNNVPGKSVSSIAFDDENMWVGTEAGLGRFFSGSWITYTAVPDGLISSLIKSVASDGRTLWAGTRNGLSSYDILENKWTSYTAKNTGSGLADDDILALALVNDILLVGTAGGLSKFDGKVWSRIAPDEIPHVLCMTVQGSTLWIGTQNGLLKGKI